MPLKIILLSFHVWIPQTHVFRENAPKCHIEITVGKYQIIVKKFLDNKPLRKSTSINLATFFLSF